MPTVLRQRGIPFVFVTGYEDAAVLPQEFRNEPWVGKPLQETALIATLSEAIRGIS